MYRFCFLQPLVANRQKEWTAELTIWESTLSLPLVNIYVPETKAGLGLFTG